MTNNLIPTYEQFMTDYVADEVVSQSYQCENEAWDAEKSIGCGQSQSTNQKIKEGVVIVGKSIATGAIAGAVVSTGGLLAIPIGGAIYAEGWLLNKLAEETQSPKIAVVADFIEDVGIGSMISGSIKGVATSAKLIANESVRAGVMGVVEVAKDKEEFYGLMSNCYEAKCKAIHIDHQAEGKDYDKDCVICQQR